VITLDVPLRAAPGGYPAARLAAPVAPRPASGARSQSGRDPEAAERPAWAVLYRRPRPEAVRPATIEAEPTSAVARSAVAEAPASDPLAPTDEDLLRAVQDGEAEALAALYDRYGRRCFAVAYRVLDDGAAAEDAVQEAFLAVWRQAGSFRPERGAVRTWLLAITRNAAVDRRRGRHARPLGDVPLDEVEARLTTDADDTFEVAAATLLQERVQAALADLPAEQRQAIDLAFFQGLTHQEIAERTGLPLGTVKGRLRLGLRKLRVLLAPAAAGTFASIGTGVGDD
jgi:RNA polymerase sigma-70 factor (ECF subfamily)